MDRLLISVSLGLTLACSASFAQINVQNDESDVRIGPGGINVRTREGTNLNISPSGIFGTAGGQTNLNIGPRSGVNVHTKATTHTSVRHSGSATASAQTKPGQSLAQQVELIEMAAYGQTKFGKPLTARVTQLEMDNLGKTGQGALNVRIKNLAAALGVNLSGNSSTTHARSSASSGGQVSVGASANGANGANGADGSASVNITGRGININAGTDESGEMIVLNNSGQQMNCDVKNGSVTVNSSASNIELKGNCNKLVVNGHQNNIHAEWLATLVVNGGSNTVTWPSNCKPRIVDNGSGNRLTPR